MRGGVRLPAAIVAVGLLAGCSDPAGAVRRDRAAARKASPSATAAPGKTHVAAATWWQAPGGLKTANGLRVRTGVLRQGSMRVSVTDVSGKARRVFTAMSRAHGATVGHFTLTGIKIAKSAKTGTYGVTFRYRLSG